MAGKTIIRGYRPEDKPAIMRIYERVWGKDKADGIASLWEWKYHNNPYQSPGHYHSLVAEVDGQVIGFVGCYAARLKLGDKTLDATCTADLVVDPSHRGFAGARLCKTLAGIELTSIGKADSGTEDGAIAYKLWKKIGPRIKGLGDRLNLVKRISIEGALMDRLHIRFLATVGDYLWRLLRDTRLKRHARAVDSEIQVQEIDRFDECEALLTEIMAECVNMHVREVAYMNWRFCERPDTKYNILLASSHGKPVGYAVLRVLVEHGKTNGRIVELMALKGEHDALAALLAEAEAVFRKKGVRIATTLGSRDHEVNEAIENAGYSQKGIRIKVSKFLGQGPDEGFYDRGGWRFTMADSDFEMD